MRAAVAIAKKDLLLLSRDRAALFWAFAFPMLFALLFGTMRRGSVDRAPADLAVSVVLEGTSPRAIALADALAESPALRVRRRALAEAEAEVQRGAELAYVRVTDRTDEPFLLLVHDPTRGTEAAMLEAMLERAAAAGAPRAVATSQLTSGRLARTGFEIVFPVAVLWGLVGCAGSFAVAMVAERSRGTHLRLFAAPISAGEVLAGKALACFVACLVDAVVLSALARLALGVRIDQPALFAAALVASAVCFVGITVLLSVLGRTPQSVGGAGWATLLFLSMLGGGMVPLAVMPAWLRAASALSPVRWGVEALEGASWRGASARELAAPVAWLVAVGLVTFLVGTLRARATVLRA